MNLEINRSVTRRVRGLHMALRMQRRNGHYFGNRTVVEVACNIARQGLFKYARETLAAARRNHRNPLPANESITRTAEGFNKLSDACNAAAETVTDFKTAQDAKPYRFTPNAARFLGLDGRVTSKYTEVMLTDSQARAVRDRIHDGYSVTVRGSNGAKLIEAALNVINAGLK